MKDNHIIEILEQASFTSLSKTDLIAIEIHTNECENCRRAYEAAYVASALLQQRAAELFAPPPFFETRVLAVLREKRADDAWGFARLWRTAGALVSSMAATVAVLAALSFALPSGDVASNVVSAANTYSAEAVMFGENDPADDQVSDSQVLTTLYDTDEEVAK